MAPITNTATEHQAPNGVLLHHPPRNAAMQHQTAWGETPPPSIDHRDAFIAWLKGEFAAANAIIDTLCHHLQSMGEKGEYDVVWRCVQHRRSNWASILYMQQFLSVAEVVNALQQVADIKPKRNEPRQESHAAQTLDDEQSSGPKALDEAEIMRQPPDGADCRHSALYRCNQGLMDMDINFPAMAEQGIRWKRHQFDWSESSHGRTVNSGIDVIEDVFSPNELSSIASLTTKMQNAGRQGELGSIFTTQKTMEGAIDTLHLGHGLETDEVQSMPKFVHSIIDWLVHKGVLSINARPDSCVISFFEEGCAELPVSQDCSKQHISGILSVLGDCKVVLRHAVSLDQSGQREGPFQVTLKAGSLLLLKASSMGIVKRAVPALPTKRVIIVFEKVLECTNRAEITECKSEGQSETKTPASASIYKSNQATSMQTLNHKPDMQASFSMIPVHLLPTQINHMVPQHPFLGAPPLSFSPTFTGQLGCYPPVPVVTAPKVPSSGGTGVFFPSNNPDGYTVEVPSWQSGLLVLSPFSHRATEFRRSVLARRPPRQASKYIINHVKSTGHSGALEAQKKLDTKDQRINGAAGTENVE